MNSSESEEIYSNFVVDNEDIQTIGDNPGLDVGMVHFEYLFACPSSQDINRPGYGPSISVTKEYSFTKDILAEAVETSGLGKSEEEVQAYINQSETVKLSEILEPSTSELESIRRHEQLLLDQRNSLSTPPLVPSRSLDEFDSLQNDLSENTAENEITQETTAVVDNVPSTEEMVRKQILYKITHEIAAFGGIYGNFNQSPYFLPYSLNKPKIFNQKTNLKKTL